MLVSQIKAMPYSDNTNYGPTSGSVDCSRPTSLKRPSCDKPLPHCKKRKKLHKWPKKCHTRENDKVKCKPKKRIRTKPEAPFNSTQFIMEEHDILNDSDLSTRRPRRQRDSSLSMDSDEEDNTYISPEEEEEKQLFLRRQFWNAYEAYNAERLYDMNKTQLVQEYFLLEERLTEFERELGEAREQDRRKLREVSPIDDEEDEEAVPGEVPVDPETAAKIEIFRSEILKLEEENQNLAKESELLRRKHSCRRCANILIEFRSLSDSEGAVEIEDPHRSYTFSSREFSNTEELEIAAVLKAPDDVCDDSGIGSSEGVSSASSGEDAKEKDNGKQTTDEGLPVEKIVKMVK